MFSKASITLIVSAVLAGTVAAQGLDRHPELKSRSVAWTAYDGSFLLDNNSRAEVLDFYWSVMQQPYPVIGWTGSLVPENAGSTSEAWRVREYSQLNAYRAIAGLNQADENAALLEGQQQGALVMALNQKVSHSIDPTWKGYTNAAWVALATSNLWNPAGDARAAGDGFIDNFIHDASSIDPTFVGHRKNLLAYGITGVAAGAAKTAAQSWAAIKVSNLTNFTSVPQAAFVAYPAPGYFPKGLMKNRPSDPSSTPTFRWSFQSPWEGSSDYNFDNVVITATRDGKAIAVLDPQKHQVNSQWTWYFSAADVNPAEAGDTTIEITVTGAIVRRPPYQGTGAVNYRYVVKLFDEQQITQTSFNPQTPLVNISTRGIVGAGERQMIAGFAVAGTLPVRVAIRAQGPSLSRFGISNTARKPHLYLYDEKGNRLGDNAGWKQHPNWRMLQSYALNPSDDNEPAMVVTLWPGLYSAILGDDAGTDGIAIVEAFNIDGETPTRLANLSTRGVVGQNDEQLIAGIIVKDTPRTFVIRTQGPSLAQFGISQPANDTRIALFTQADGKQIASNDDWKAEVGNARLMTDLAGYAPQNNREAALVVTLQPGAYTAVVDAKGTNGIGIVEVFDIQ